MTGHHAVALGWPRPASKQLARRGLRLSAAKQVSGKSLRRSGRAHGELSSCCPARHNDVMARRELFQALVIVITALVLASCSGKDHQSGNLSSAGASGQLSHDAAAAGSPGGTTVVLGGSPGVGGISATGGSAVVGGSAAGGAGGGAGGASRVDAAAVAGGAGGAPRVDAGVAGGAGGGGRPDASVGSGGSGGTAGGGSGGSGGTRTTIGNGCTLSSDCPPGWICATGFCWAPVGGGGAGGAGGVTGSGGRATGGITSSGGSGGSTERCSTTSGCTLIDDCCNCALVPTGTPAPVSCPGVACDLDMCAQRSVPHTQADFGCSNGFCAVLSAPGDCNASEVTCSLVKPSCPAGYLPAVVNHCWGPCIAEHGCVSTGTGGAAGAGGSGGSTGSGGMGGSAGSTGTGDYAGVLCGGVTCNGGLACCVSQTMASQGCSTVSVCKQDWAVTCDGPEDCGGAGHQRCMPSGAVIQTSCVSGSCLAGLAMCHTSSDCPQGQNCCPATLFGYAYGTCQASSCN